MAHYCGQPPKIDEIDIFILINAANGFAHKNQTVPPAMRAESVSPPRRISRSIMRTPIHQD